MQMLAALAVVQAVGVPVAEGSTVATVATVPAETGLAGVVAAGTSLP
jgi:hypothetical protein